MKLLFNLEAACKQGPKYDIGTRGRRKQIYIRVKKRMNTDVVASCRPPLPQRNCTAYLPYINTNNKPRTEKRDETIARTECKRQLVGVGDGNQRGGNCQIYSWGRGTISNVFKQLPLQELLIVNKLFC
jgi:hypothetical protein